MLVFQPFKLLVTGQSHRSGCRGSQVRVQGFTDSLTISVKITRNVYPHSTDFNEIGETIVTVHFCGIESFLRPSGHNS